MGLVSTDPGALTNCLAESNKSRNYRTISPEYLREMPASIIQSIHRPQVDGLQASGPKDLRVARIVIRNGVCFAFSD